MSATPAPVIAASAYAFPNGLLLDVLAVSLTAVNLLRPLYGPSGTELVDFAVEYLNPAAQRITGLAEQPGITTRARFPDIFLNGVFEFYRRVFETGEAGQYNFNYQADGFDNYFYVAARRSGDLLVVSFTDTADHDRSPVERALRESQAAEKAARAEAEVQRQLFEALVMEAPAPIMSLAGPAHTIVLANPHYHQLFGQRPLLGKTIREALPELEGQPYFGMLDDVYRTGDTFVGNELPVRLDRTYLGELELGYYNFINQATRDASGAVTGVLVFAYEVTEQVLARQQLQQLNQDLEARVQARTAEGEAARHETERQRRQFEQLLLRAPAAICIFGGPAWVYEFVNPSYEAMFPGRQLLGKPLLEALPEVADQPLMDILHHVYDTGETYEGKEILVPLARTDEGPIEDIYFDLTYQARFDETGQIDGFVTFAQDVTEQVWLRRQRKAQEQQLHELFEQAPVAIAIFRGPRYVIELANPAVCAIWGRTPAQALHTPLFELLPEAAGQGFEELLDGVMATGVPYVARELPSFIDRAGRRETVYWNFVYQPLREAGDQITAITVVATDVTAQVQARQQAEESEAQVRSFIEAVPFPIGVFVGPDMRIQFANQAILQGWSKGPTVIGQRFADVLPELEHQAVFEQAQQAYATGTPFHARSQRLEVLIDGTPQTFYYNYSFLPLRDAAGRVYGVLNTAADVTDVAEARLRIEQFAAEVQESEQRFRTMADAAPNMVWALHPDSSIRYINRAFLDFVGVSQQQYQATGWSTYLHPDELAGAQQVLTEAIAQRGFYTLEHRMRRHDGQFRWLLAQGAPSYYPNGDLYGYVGSAIDITDLKQANEQLVRTNADLDNFIYTASHDLKVPIANIEGLLYALRKELPADLAQPPNVGLILARMLNSVERFTRTIGHLTEVSKLQKEHDAPAGVINLAAVVEDVRLDLAPLFEGANAQLTVAVADFPPVLFSEKNLRSVVYNLLSNALKYRHPDRPPQIAVQAHVLPDHTVLEVHDNGLGIAAAHLPKLFTMFQRFHTHVEGTGIGLYMVKRMVDNAGGRIDVHSQLGTGTTFFVRLPHATSST